VASDVSGSSVVQFRLSEVKLLRCASLPPERTQSLQAAPSAHAKPAAAAAKPKPKPKAKKGDDRFFFFFYFGNVDELEYDENDQVHPHGLAWFPCVCVVDRYVPSRN
jgi:hypothetical protein